MICMFDRCAREARHEQLCVAKLTPNGGAQDVWVFTCDEHHERLNRPEPRLSISVVVSAQPAVRR